MKIGMYTENDYFELFGEHNFLGRSMYDAIFDKIHALITENEQLKINCNIGNDNLKFYKKQLDLYKSVIDEAIYHIRNCCNMDSKFVNLHFDYAQNEMSANQVDDLLEILDKVKENNNV